jgi:hypothetical protein
MTETIHSPTCRSITFDDPPEFEAKGRNGFIKTTGVTLMKMTNGEIHLGCITSKGVASDTSRLPVPKSAVIPLAHALLAMAHAEEVTPREVIITPDEADAAKTLISIAVNASGEHRGLEQILLEALDADRIVIAPQPTEPSAHSFRS